MNEHVYKVSMIAGDMAGEECEEEIEVLLRVGMPYLNDIQRAFYDHFKQVGDASAKKILSIEYLGEIVN